MKNTYLQKHNFSGASKNYILCSVFHPRMSQEKHVSPLKTLNCWLRVLYREIFIRVLGLFGRLVSKKSSFTTSTAGGGTQPMCILWVFVSK